MYVHQAHRASLFYPDFGRTDHLAAGSPAKGFSPAGWRKSEADLTYLRDILQIGEIVDIET